MKVEVIAEDTMVPALFGLGLSYGKTSDTTYVKFATEPDEVSALKGMYKVAKNLAGKGLGHDKFLRAITVHIDADMPLYWWKEMDTYKIGTVTQSESTMHTLAKKKLDATDFELEKTLMQLEYLNGLDEHNKLRQLPLDFLQRRIITTNYAALGNIIKQRKNHKLWEWRYFCNRVYQQVTHQEFLPKVGYEE